MDVENNTSQTTPDRNGKYSEKFADPKYFRTFHPANLLLVLLIPIIIGLLIMLFPFLLVPAKTPESLKTNNNANPSITPPSQKDFKPVWKTYKSTKANFEIQYPDIGIAPQEKSYDLKNTKINSTEIVANGTAVSVLTYKGAELKLNELGLGIDTSKAKNSTISVAGIETKKSEMPGAFMKNGNLTLVGPIVHSGTNYMFLYISGILGTQGQEEDSTFEKMLQTFKFTQGGGATQQESASPKTTTISPQPTAIPKTSTTILPTPTTCTGTGCL